MSEQPEQITVRLSREEMEAARNALESIDIDLNVRDRGEESMEQLDERAPTAANDAWAKLRAALSSKPSEEGLAERVRELEDRAP